MIIRIRGANRFLLLAGAGSLGISLLHFTIPVLGPWAFGYFGAAGLMPAVRAGSLLPAVLTWTLAALFALFGAYALSGAGLIRRLPALQPALAFIGLVYVLRGLALLPELARILQGALSPSRGVVFSAVSLTLGLLYAAGLTALRRRWKLGESPPVDEAARPTH